MTQNYSVTFAAAAGGASNTGGQHVLYTNGPFSIIGQCYVPNNSASNLNAAVTFLTTTDAPSAPGALSSWFSGDIAPFNSTNSGVDLVRPAGIGSGTVASPAGTNNPQYVGVGEATGIAPSGGANSTATNTNAVDGGLFSAISGNGATEIQGQVGQGVNVAGSNCVFTGSISHTP